MSQGAHSRKALRGRLDSFINKLLSLHPKIHWRIIGGITLLIIAFEIFELLSKDESLLDPFHLIELIVYVLILFLVGVLIGYLSKMSSDLNHTLEILNYKHSISQDLVKPSEWNTLTTSLVTLPNNLSDVDASRLLVRDPISGQMDLITTWYADGSSSEKNFGFDCQKCLPEREWSELEFNPCFHNSETSDPTIRANGYCLPIIYADQLLAVIQFKLKMGEVLSPNQMEIFESIRPEIALALKTSQEQKRLSEYQLTETALAERHSISNYLHDNLSQNLAYLCLKLDQYSADDELSSGEHLKSDFARLRETANQSYEMVRGMIETIHPKTTPHLDNLFSEYSQMVSQRANIEISIKNEGEPLAILPEIQQAVFYVFQEVLSNIEKHARADQVNVIIQWNEDSLAVAVSDNGIGFYPQQIDRSKHFGMGIMRERIEKLDGQLDIISSKNTGTTVTFSIPFRLSIKKGHLG